MNSKGKSLRYLKYLSYDYKVPGRTIVLNFAPGVIEYSYRLANSKEDENSGNYSDWRNEKRIQIETLLGTFKQRTYKQPEDVEITDGECWELEYMFEDEDKPHYKYGNRAHPPLWCFLMDILHDIAGNWTVQRNWYNLYSVRFISRDTEIYYMVRPQADIEVGDSVIAPFGEQILKGEVVRIDRFPDDQLPIPIDKMKYILDKLEP